jgi:outer membrane protein TolC
MIKRIITISLLLLLAGFPAVAQEPEVSPGSDADEGLTRPVYRERPDLLEDSSAVIDAIAQMEEFLSKQSADEEQLAGDPITLNPRRCVELALAQNPQGIVADAEVDVSAARVGQAKSGFLPQITASSSFTHTEFDDVGFGSGGPFEPILTLITDIFLGDFDVAPPNDFRVDKLELNQTIYAGGQIRAGLEASRYLQQSEEWRRESTLQEIEFNAKQAFYDALATQALVRVAEASISTFERQLYDAEQMFNVGRMSKYAVESSRTELSARVAGRVEARNAERLALANLRRVLALPQDTPIVLESELEWLPIALNVNELNEYAAGHTPALLAIDEAISAAGQDIRRAKGQFMPRVGANAQYQHSDNGGLTQPNGWTLSIGAELDLYAGGRKKHEVREARARLESIEAQREDLRYSIELGVKQAVIQIRDSMARIQSEVTTLGFARRTLSLAELRFSEGLGTTSQTLDADLALTNAETSMVRALRDYAVANAVLERAIGRSWRDDVKAIPEEEEQPEPEQ